MAHIFLDESRSAGPIAVLALVAIDETNRNKLSQLLSLPDPATFNQDAYNLLYRMENNELQNPEYAFRRIQRAYFSVFSFSDQIREKVNSVLKDISTLKFQIFLSIYNPKLAEKFNLPQSQLKNYHTRNLLAYYVANNISELGRDSIVSADPGFYSSQHLHLIKTSFRGPLRVGVWEEDEPARKYNHMVDKKIEITASYDSKGIQLADIVAGISARAIYKSTNCEPFYSTIKDKISVLLDNRLHEPKYQGGFLQPSPIKQHIGVEMHKPNLSKIRA